MASGDALPIARKNVAFRVTFPILDADGDLVTGASGLDSEISKDGGTFTDCTNEATEIATSSGMYYLDLTSTEMNADTVAIIVKTSTSGAKTTPIVLYPAEDAELRANVVQFGGTAATTSGGRPEVNTTHAAGTAWGSGAITAASIASNAITDAKIASGAFTAAKFAAGAFDAVWSVATRLLTAGTNIALAKGTGVTGFNDLDAAGVRSAVGLASANLDTQLDALPTTAEVNAEVDQALADYDPPTKTELDSAVAPLALEATLGSPAGASVSADIAAIKSQTADIEADTQDLQTQVGTDGAGLTAIPWNANWDAEVESEVADALEATIADSIPSDGTRPSVKQALYMLTQFMLERSVSSTTMTVNKVDGTTALFTLTLDDDTNPTSVTRAT